MTTGKTTNLRTAIRWIDRPAIISTIVVGIFLLAGLLAAIGRYTSAPASAVTTVPTPNVVIVFATQQAPIVPTAAPAVQVASVSGNTLARAVVAYDAPNGTVLGAIEQGRAYTAIAAFGAAWLQLDIAGSGRVWVRTSEVLGSSDLVDLAPKPTAMPERVIIVAAEPAYVVDAAPTPARDPPVKQPLSAAIVSDHFLAGRDVYGRTP